MFDADWYDRPADIDHEQLVDIEECDRALEAIDYSMMIVKDQIESADMFCAEHGRHEDPGWYRRAQGFRRRLSYVKQMVQRRRGTFRRALNSEHRTSWERKFVKAASAKLPEDLFDSICKMVDEMEESHA